MTQYFYFMLLAFDVDRAIEMVEGREPSGWCDVLTTATAYGLVDPEPGPVTSINILAPVELNREHAMSTDLSKPLIVASLGDKGGSLIIDGYHRLYKAYKTEVKELPFHKLSIEETEQIMEKRI
ncbi:hypothetical protein [Actinomadura rubrisoli]|uniref:ParB/Sulfiredoxin domain-containing protein n=1 Tax=Actinomadura rubrisoli TaxID=2530368 RepID=A0A4R5CB75_9ACTN|nr:hypothetical protein [Actinomadura rubrisoli]TDD97198.1 hypothetical protein E1298_01815 [Actinomadura rubrisoli]